MDRGRCHSSGRQFRKTREQIFNLETAVEFMFMSRLELCQFSFMKAVLSLGSAQNLVIAYSTHEVRKDQLCRFTKAFQCHTNLAQNTILVGV